MKKLKNILLLSLGLFAASCSNDYLDEPAPTDSVAPDVAYGSYEGAKAHMAGILRRTRGQYTTNADSGNISALYFAREVKGNVSAVSNNWFVSDYENVNREPNYRRPVFTWNFLYTLINQVNAFIAGVEGSAMISPEQKNELLGQAYTMRANYYFELSLDFQHTYKYDPSLLTLPIYKQSGATEGLALSTMQEVYDFILADLEKAIQIGVNARSNKSYFNKSVSYAVAARVYQVMENWAKAKDYANKAYGGSPSAVLSPTFYQSGFDDMDEGNEWLLAMPQSSDQSNYYFLAPHGFYTRTESAYNNTFITKSFVALFSTSDVRNQFAKTGATDYREWYTKKFKFAFDADFALIRTPEMILIEAEAMYKLGDTAGAHDLLFSLQKNRDVNAVKTSATGVALFEEILLERKKELYGEMGIEWYDAKRLRRGIARDSWHRVNMVSDPLKADDKRFFLKIPQAEIDANPNIPKDINANK